MSTTVKVARSTIIQTVALGVRTAVTFLITIYLIRYLGVKEYGNFLTIFTFITLFNAILDLGISDMAVREISKDKTKANILIGNIFILKLLISFAVMLLTCISANILGYNDEVKAGIYVISLSLPLTVFGVGSFGIIFRVYLRMEYQSFADIVQNLLFFLMMVLVGNSGGTLFEIVSTYNIAILIGSLIVIFFSRKFVRPIFKIDKEVWKGLFTSSLPLILAGFLGIIAYKAEILLLSLMKGAESVGFYGVPYKLIDLVLMLAGFLAVSVYPIFSELFHQNREKLERVFQESFTAAVAIGCIITCILYIFADPIITLIYKGETGGPILSLKILSISVIFIWGSYILSYLLYAAEMQSKYLYVTAAGIVTNLCLNYLYIPQYGYFAASAVKGITIAVETFLLLYFLSKVFNMGKIILIGIKAIICGICIIGITEYFAGDSNIFFKIFLLISSTGVSMMMLRLLTKEDVTRLLNTLRTIAKSPIANKEEQ